MLGNTTLFCNMTGAGILDGDRLIQNAVDRFCRDRGSAFPLSGQLAVISVLEAIAASGSAMIFIFIDHPVRSVLIFLHS